MAFDVANLVADSSEMPRAGLVAVLLIALGGGARAQSPELSLREFASGQIKKGVRSIGFGGDGATWGNYSLVWRDAGTALIDAGATGYTNGNIFVFTAVGATTPPLWRGLCLYAIGLGQTANDVALKLQSPALGPVPRAVHGSGGNQALFVKLAMPLPHGFAIGVLLSYEVSQFNSRTDAQPSLAVQHHTQWRPSGGFGVTWQNARFLAGIRAIFNHDEEFRSDDAGTQSGLARGYEYRAGASMILWKGGLIDVGGTLLERANGLTHTESIAGGANLGFEQAFFDRRLVFRVGVDECTFGVSGCTYGAGISLKRMPVNFDLAYLYNLGSERIGSLFGAHSHSVLATLTLDYMWLVRRGERGPASPVPRPPAIGVVPQPPAKS